MLQKLKLPGAHTVELVCLTLGHVSTMVFVNKPLRRSTVFRTGNGLIELRMKPVPMIGVPKLHVIIDTICI